MKRLLFILLFIPTLLVGQQPFYGNRSFISLDGNDTLNLRFNGDTIYFESTDSVYFDKLLNIGGGGGSLSVGTDGQIPYTNAAGDDFSYSDNFKWNGNALELEADSGVNNVFVGKESGYSNTTGVNNVFVGKEPGYSNTTG